MKKFLVALTLALVLVLGCVVIASADDGAVAEKAVVAYGDLSSITSIGGHAVVPFNPETDKLYREPTCTVTGIAYFKCAEETHTLGKHVVYVETIPHTWKEEVTEATCTSTGKTQLICSVCGYKGNEYITPKAAHKFTKIVYFAGMEPSCAGAGYGYVVCSVCGQKQDADMKAPVSYKEAAYVDDTTERTYTANANKILFNDEKKWAKSPALSHSWSKWSYDPEATCAAVGAATRTCRKCGSIQGVDVNTPENTTFYYVDGKEVTEEDYNAVKAQDEKRVKKETVFEILKKIQKLNPGYAALYEEYNNADADGKIVNEGTVKEQSAFEKAAKDAKVEIKLKSSEIYSCYTRKVTYVCAICNSTLKNKAGTIEHPPIVMLVNAYAHSWTEKPLEAKEITAKFLTEVPESKDFVATAEEAEAFIREQAGIDEDGVFTGDKSIKPSCELPGINIFLCKYDITIDDENGTHLHPEDKDYLAVMVPALGHKWGAWDDVKTYDETTGGEVIVRSRVCSVCGKIEHKTEGYEAPVVPVKNGLTKDDDGTWRYYKDGEFQDDLTAHVDFEGGKFLIINGELAEDCDGLVLSPVDNTFHLMVDGQLKNDSTTVVYGDDTFMVINGVLNTEANGLYDYNGGKFVFAAGRLIKTVNGLWLNPQDNKFYYLANGQVQTQHSGVVEYNGEFFVVKNGVFDSSYNGTIEYDGKTFNVSNGQLYAIPVAEEPAA